MYFWYVIFGLLIGLFLAGSGNDWLLAAIGGAAIGVLLARIVVLDRRVNQLESSSSRSKIATSDSAPADATPIPVSQTADPQIPVLSEEVPPWFEKDNEKPGKDNRPFRPTGPLPQTSAIPRHEQALPGPSILQIIVNKASTWITTGNIPVKVGVIISFFGVGFLLKYAIDHELLVLSLEVRLLAVAVAGLIMLAIGWRLRNKERVYALSLQGGGVGILFLTVFSALQLWQLLPATLAFFLLVTLTFITGALAVTQNARMLAILGVVGGFLAPILASTGQGHHVVLFSYYLVLNAAILGIAWFRAWRGLNLIGWLFTFIIGSLWGYQYYKPELLPSTQPFLILYFLFYQVIAILFALRQPPKRIGIVDGTLVFGTPIVVFALQAALVEGLEDALAVSAIIVASFYVLTATWLWRSKGPPLRLLTESFIALAVIFATIAIPLAFDARWTAAAWAVEGAGLVWVGTRQGRQLAKLAGTLLVFFSGLAFIEGSWHRNTGLPVLNGNVLGGLLISLSAFFTSRRLETLDIQRFKSVQTLASAALFIWGLLWWFGTGWMEITERVGFIDQAGHHNRAPVFLLFLSLSMGAGAWLGHVRDWLKARWAAMLLLPMLILPAWAFTWDHDHFLVGLGWLAWPLAWTVQAYVLKVLDKNHEHGAANWHFGSLLLLTTGLAIEAWWWTTQLASDAWAGAVAATVAGIMSLLIWHYNHRPLWPFSTHPRAYLKASLLLVASQVLLLLTLAVSMPGNADPMPYIPVFNPFDLAMLFAMLTATKLLNRIGNAGTDDSEVLPPYFSTLRALLAGAFFILTTVALVRSVHQLTGVAWNADTLFDSIVVQTSLSIYWGVLGFAGMIWGARSAKRSIWLVGAGFMALVVFKLFVVDLGNTGTVARIVSFIGVGVLLLVVGYFAPAPPKTPKT